MPLHNAKRRHGQAKRFHTLCFSTNSWYCILRCVGSLSACCWMGKRICFLLRSVIYISLESSGENKTDFKDMFNYCYIFNKQITNYSIESALYGFLFTRCKTLKTHSFAALTRSFCNVLQLVNKNPYVALSVK